MWSLFEYWPFNNLISGRAIYLPSKAFYTISVKIKKKKKGKPVKPVSYVRKMSPLHPSLVEGAEDSAADQSKDRCD